MDAMWKFGVREQLGKANGKMPVEITLPANATSALIEYRIRQAASGTLDRLWDREKLVRASIADISRWSFGSRQLPLNIDDEAASRVTSICRPETVQVKLPMQPGFGLTQ
jgi:hypothetical protein